MSATRRWSDEAIAEAFVDWFRVPDVSATWEVAGARVVRFPAYAPRRMHAALHLTGSGDPDPATLLDEVASLARSAGEPEVRLHVAERPAHEELLTALLRRGDAAVFDEKPADDGRVADLVAECRVQWEACTDARFVAWRGDEPLGSGGMSRAGEVLRLWGGATLPAARRQGVYAAVLRTRLATGWDWGTTLAVVRGRVETSAPLLESSGFSVVGRQLAVVMPVPDA